MNYTILNKLKKIFFITAIILLCFGFPKANADGTWKNYKNISVYIPQGDDKTTLMKKAFEAWEQKTHNKFSFQMVNTIEEADINVIFIEKNLESYCGYIEAMGCSQNKYVDNNIVHSTIYIAKRRPKGLLLSNTQVFAVMRHEIGHSLGLAHTKNYNDIMYPMTNLAIATRQDIRSGDIQALYKLYGINPRK